MTLFLAMMARLALIKEQAGDPFGGDWPAGQ
jgi:hypothetical protein